MDKKIESKKIINFRPLFFIFIIGAFCIYFSFLSTNSPFYLFLFTLPLAFLLYVTLKQRYLLLVFSTLFFVFISIFTFFHISNFNDGNFSNTPVLLTAKIEKVTFVNDNFYYLTLSNGSVLLQNNSTQKLNGNVSVGVNVYDTDDFSLTQFSQIAFQTHLSSIDVKDENGELNTFFLKWNIRYETGNTSLSAITFLKDDSTLIEKFQTYNKTLLMENFGETKGGLVFHILYGDKSSSPKEIVEQFAFAGVVHVLSVSGLHVGLIVFLLMFFLSKLHLKDHTKFIIITIFLSLFCTFCSFSPSVVRASIMALIVVTSTIFSRKNDLLNSLSFAGIIILLFNPLYLFDAGFQMSFASIFGIILIAFSLKFIIKNKKTYSFLLPVFCTIAAQLMILPIIATIYGYIPTWSILFNLIILPLFSLMYPLLFVINIIVAVFPFFSFLYLFPSAFLDVILFIVSRVSLLPFNLIYTPKISVTSTIILFSAIYFASKYVVLKLSIKSIISIFLLSIFALTISISSFSAVCSSNFFTFYESESCLGTLFATQKSQFYLIEPDLNRSKEIAEELERLKIKKLDGVFMLTHSNFESTKVHRYLFDFSPTIYLPQGSIHQAGLSSMNFETQILSNEKLVVNEIFSIRNVEYDSSPLALIFEIQTSKIVFFSKDIVMNVDLKNYISINFDYEILCVKIEQSENYEEWRTEIAALNFFFNSSSKQSFVIP